MGEAIRFNLGQLRKSHGSIAVNEVHDRGMPWAHAVNLGLIPGCTRAAALGTNPAVAAGASFWYGTGAYPWIPSARTLEIVSTDANDTLAGTGIQKVSVNGLDANYNSITETVSMNGTTAVPLVNQYLRINRMINIQAGSSNVNVGTINLRDAGAGPVRAIIPVAPGVGGIGIISQAAFTVPAGFTLIVQSVLLSILRGNGSQVNNITMRNFTRSAAGALILPLALSTGSNLPYRHEAGDGYPVFTVGEKSDFDLVCTDASAAVAATASWVGILVQNSTVLAN